MSEHESIPWLTGEIFDGHYTVNQLIARGGMAEVYHGVDLWSNNPVAIKVLSPQFSGDPSQQQKFFREERSLRQINHEHVVGVIGSGTQKIHAMDVMYIVLDYVHGCTLQQLLTRRTVLSVEETLEIILPAVEGLSEVHAHRLIHRDIKPSNILISATEHSIKLTDFGLTRRLDQHWTGELMGTPAYVAPEIVDPQAQVGPAVDIFAVGVVMFRMLTGRLPFTGMGDDQQIIYHNVNTEFPSVAQFAPGIDSDLQGVIRWCTRKQASSRPVDGTELFEVLKNIRAQLSTEELQYRAPLDNPPHTTLWEDVTLIAESTGATRVLERTPMSGFADSEALLDEEELDELYRVQEYEPHIISGVGPDLPDEIGRTEDPTKSYDARIFSDFPSSHHQEDMNTATSAAQQPAFEPISAEYRGSRISEDFIESQPEPSQNQSWQKHASKPAKPRSPRVATEQWQSPPTLIAIVITFLLLLFAIVAAGFIGWELAHLVLVSQWFASYQGLLDSLFNR